MLKVAIDQGVDLKKLKELQRSGVLELTQANELEQTWEQHVSQQKKGFMIGHSRLDGPDVLADDRVHEVERIVGLDKRVDIAHVYAAYLNRCDYFVTEDTKAFIIDGRREALEAVLGVRIRRTSELLSELEGGDASRRP
jgi:hypothetical protein